MSITDRKPHTVTERMVFRGWHCWLCGKAFAEGDIARWFYRNGRKNVVGNIIVCPGCDEPDNEDAMHARVEQDERQWRRLRLLGYPTE